MKTIDRHFHEWATKDMSESTQPWFDKTIVHPHVVRTAHDRIETRVGEYCFAIRLPRHLFKACEDFGKCMLGLGDDEETAIRKACELASDMVQHARAA